MNRRDFIRESVSAAALTSLASCGMNGNWMKDGKLSPTHKTLTGQMEMRTIGTGDAREAVSLLGYGCMRWPERKALPGQNADKSAIDQEAVNRLVDRAIEAGVNYFDTAPVYCGGQCEKVTGTALSRHSRDSYKVATKLSNFRKYDRETSEKMYRQSFENLQVDKIDYYLLHALGKAEGFKKRFIDNGMLEFLLGEREKGKIGALGFSYHGDDDFFLELMEMHSKYHWDFVQIQMNYVDWNYAAKTAPGNSNASFLYKELESRGIPVVIMEPLLGGRLADIPDSLEDRLYQAEPSRSLSSWAFRFCGTYPGVLTVLSGMSCMEHLNDNLSTFCGFKPLTDSDMRMLEGIAGTIADYPAIPCNDCGYCMPCHYGLDIPAIFRHYNKCVNEGDLISDKLNPDYRRARRRFLLSYDKDLPRSRQADKCIGCNHCQFRCPQDIDIPKELRRIDRYVEKLKDF